MKWLSLIQEWRFNHVYHDKVIIKRIAFDRRKAEIMSADLNGYFNTVIG